jgi:predicted metalloendopeptidase
MAIGVKYIEAAFDIEAKGRVDELVDNLIISFRELLGEASWMEDSTKSEAEAKVGTIKSFMAFPEWLENKTAVEEYFKGLELVNGTEAHFQSVLNIGMWSSDGSLSQLREPTTQDEWLTYPGVVNAFYSPQHNSITFPAGILQPPFFGKLRPASQNYGGIGVVIGHEITHGFDNQGAQFDKDGNAINWWDPVTLEKFNGKAQCMVDQYSKFYASNIDMFVNGQLTLGENIADNGGLRESFRAYRKYVAGLGKEEGRLPGLEYLTPNQLFFLGYANIWCESITDEGLINQILTDPHSPAQFRVTGPLRNSMDFAEAYACPVSSDGMNPPVEEKCTVW